MNNTLSKLQRDAEYKLRYSPKNKPIVNMVFFQRWQWVFEKILKKYKLLVSDYTIIPSVTPLDNCAVYQYWRGSWPAAQEHFATLHSEHVCFTRGIHMIHDSPYDIDRSYTRWREQNLNKFAGVLCTSQEQVEYYSSFVDTQKLIYAPLAPLRQFSNTHSRGKIKLGFVANIYGDGVKGENLLHEILSKLDRRKFELVLHSPNGKNFALQQRKRGIGVKEEGGFDLLLVCSRHEGTPLPLVEAIASGIPVLSTPVGESPVLLPSSNLCNTSDEFANKINAFQKDRSSIECSTLPRERTWKNFCDISQCCWDDLVVSSKDDNASNYAILTWDISPPRYIENALKAAGITTMSLHLSDANIRRRGDKHLFTLEGDIVKTLKRYGITHVFVWNGDFSDTTKGYQKTVLEQIQKHTDVKIIYAEHGWLPQTDYISFDSEGSCGRSSISRMTMSDLPTPSDEQLRTLENRRNELDISSENFIYVPLQLNTDTQITKYSPFFEDVAQLIHNVAQLFTQERIIVKPHPKDSKKNILRYQSICKTYRNVEYVMSGTGLHYAQRCGRMISINSTSINEGLLCTKPIMTYGRGVFSNKEITLEITDLNDIETQLKFLTYTPDKNDIDTYLCYLLSRQHSVFSVTLEDLKEMLYETKEEKSIVFSH